MAGLRAEITSKFQFTDPALNFIESSFKPFKFFSQLFAELANDYVDEHFMRKAGNTSKTTVTAEPEGGHDGQILSCPANDTACIASKVSSKIWDESPGARTFLGFSITFLVFFLIALIVMLTVLHRKKDITEDLQLERMRKHPKKYATLILMLAGSFISACLVNSVAVSLARQADGLQILVPGDVYNTTYGMDKYPLTGAVDTVIGKILPAAEALSFKIPSPAEIGFAKWNGKGLTDLDLWIESATNQNLTQIMLENTNNLTINDEFRLQNYNETLKFIAKRFKDQLDESEKFLIDLTNATIPSPNTTDLRNQVQKMRNELGIKFFTNLTNLQENLLSTDKASEFEKKMTEPLADTSSKYYKDNYNDINQQFIKKVSDKLEFIAFFEGIKDMVSGVSGKLKTSLHREDENTVKNCTKDRKSKYIKSDCSIDISNMITWYSEFPSGDGHETAVKTEYLKEFIKENTDVLFLETLESTEKKLEPFKNYQKQFASSVIVFTSLLIVVFIINSAFSYLTSARPNSQGRVGLKVTASTIGVFVVILMSLSLSGYVLGGYTERYFCQPFSPDAKYNNGFEIIDFIETKVDIVNKTLAPYRQKYEDERKQLLSIAHFLRQCSNKNLTMSEKFEIKDVFETQLKSYTDEFGLEIDNVTFNLVKKDVESEEYFAKTVLEVVENREKEYGWWNKENYYSEFAIKFLTLLNDVNEMSKTLAENLDAENKSKLVYESWIKKGMANLVDDNLKPYLKPAFTVSDDWKRQVIEAGVELGVEIVDHEDLDCGFITDLYEEFYKVPCEKILWNFHALWLGLMILAVVISVLVLLEIRLAGHRW